MDLPAHRLDRRMLRVWRLGSLALIAVTLALAAAALVAAGALGWPVPVVAGVAAALLAVEVADLLVSPKVEYATWRYEVTPTDVELYHGLVVRRHVVVPLVRVQHVETKESPIMRSCGLASVRVSTAGESFEIPGLTEDEARRLRDRVAELARLGAGRAGHRATQRAAQPAAPHDALRAHPHGEHALDARGAHAGTRHA